MADQLSKSQLLIKYGFIKKGFKHFYKYSEDKGYYLPVPQKDAMHWYNPAHASEEIDEEANMGGSPGTSQPYMSTGFPKPGKRYRLIYESFNMSLEEMYFWCLNSVKHSHGFPHFIKLTDVFSASENSAFFGQSAQRLSIQEDRASQFLRGISELIKTLFQIVRELRIIDERLEVYNNWKKSKSADATLKGIYADFSENKGGQMQPGSIYHLANQVGYAVLPDLFFNTVIFEKEKVADIVDALSFNPNVKTVLKRKLYQFIVWKEKTEHELNARRRFQIKYLRQHYTIIKTYMGWVKPYLKHIKRLQMNESQLDSEMLISSFETSATEIEVLAKKPMSKGSYNAVILMHFTFNTRPIMQYRQEYNQGPVHVGRGTMNLRAYAWTDKEVEMYKKMKDDEDRELLGLVDEQLKAAMDMLGDDLEAYLKEAEDTLNVKHDEYVKPPKGKKMKKMSAEDTALEPFIAVFKGFWEIGSLFIPKFGSSSKKAAGKAARGSPDGAMKSAKASMWLVYKNYKKAHKLLSW